MKAQRLARLLRDTYAQTWLDYEIRGYPQKIDLAAELGPCAMYAYRWVSSTKSVYTTSLPELEASVTAAHSVLSKLQGPAITTTAANYLESGATTQVIRVLTANLVAARNTYQDSVARLASMKSHLYRYAADTLISLEFGDAAESVFQLARARTDEFVRSVAPKAAEQLLAAEERMVDGTSEALAAAMTSCRRVLCTIADAVYPPSDSLYVDRAGRERKVGAGEYLNRLLAYVEQCVSSESSRALISSHVAHVAARLDAVYANACKGVHDDVSVDEARLVFMQTYLFIAEVARVSPTVNPDADAG